MKKIFFAVFACCFYNISISQNTFPANGSVGIGTTSPASILQVVGESLFSNDIPYVDPHPGIGYGIKIGSSGIAVNGNSVFMNGNIGVGTQDPQARLHVKHGPIMASDNSFNTINVRMYGGDIPALKFTRWTGSGSIQHNAFVGQFYNTSLSEYSFGIGTGLSNSGDQDIVSNVLTTTLAGKIGIGTINPQTALHLQNNADNVINRIENIHDGYTSIELKSNEKIWQWSKRTSSEADALALYYNNGTWNRYMTVATNGNVGIGISSPSEKFEVNGNIRSKKVIVTQSNWPDYVFESSYKLPTLDFVSAFIKENKHLPEMPSATAIEKEGLDISELIKLQQKKIEELTLYIIEQNRKIENLQQQNNEIQDLKKELEQIKSKH